MTKPLPLIVMALEDESQGMIEATGLEVLYTGVGKVNAAYALTARLARGDVSSVINMGSAGSFGFAKGMLVAPHEFVQRDMDASGLGFELGHTPFDAMPATLSFEPYFHHLPKAVCGTGDSFVQETPPVACDVVDMEAYALANICMREQVPFACAKYITDDADEGAAADWMAHLRGVAQQLAMLCEQFVLSPATPR